MMTVVSGGVSAPGASGLGGEFGCGDVVVAEGLGDDRGGHFQDVLADGAGPAGGGGDAEVADKRGEGVGVHGLPGAAAGPEIGRASCRERV